MWKLVSQQDSVKGMRNAVMTSVFLPCPSFEYNGLALNLAKMSLVSVIISLEI